VTVSPATPRGPEPRPGRTALALRDGLPWHDEVEVVRTAEDTGYEAVFVPEITGREAFARLTGLALRAERIHLGTGVVTVQARSPMTTAMAAGTVHEISGGRMVLGLGAGSVPSLRERYGGSAPVDVVREYLRVVRELLGGGTVDSTTLDVKHERLSPAFPGTPPPLWLGALGDRTIRLAAEATDGVLLNWCTPDRVAQARALVTEGAKEHGRSVADVTVAVYVRGCLGVDEAAAIEALRGMTGLYATFPRYLDQFRAMGLGEEAELAAGAMRAGRPQDVPESLVRAVSVVGGRREALARFEAYRRAGADLVICYPVPALEPFSSILGTVLAAAPSPLVER
jgi:alkanesulfonate monooxygenase SsuD/methylene tetrahydromethanopterin reductase-like flavin-dependent oxidoreductase (luciferase family)